jgi:hypothetical protein
MARRTGSGLEKRLGRHDDGGDGPTDVATRAF